jgi:hypothetical protein
MSQCNRSSIAAAGAMEERIMVRPQEKPSITERELQAYYDEFGIRHHAERLEANFGSDRALRVLDEVTRAIAARRPTLVVVKSTHK